MVCKDATLVQANDFFFSGLNLIRNTPNVVGSSLTIVTITIVSYQDLQHVWYLNGPYWLAPLGINPSHTHPRPTEISTVAHGIIQVGFGTSPEKPSYLISTEWRWRFRVSGRSCSLFDDDHVIAIVGFSSQNPVWILLQTMFLAQTLISPMICLQRLYERAKHIAYQVQSKF